MTYQEYLRKTNKLIEQKNTLYDIASKKLNQGNKETAQVVYGLIDEVQTELDNLINPNDIIPADLSELDLIFDS